MVKEKLVVDDSDKIMQFLSRCNYGQHNILVYKDLDTFREIYTHQIKSRLQVNNDAVVLLPHYESLSSARMHLRELELDVNSLEGEESLSIIDSAEVFFDKGGFIPFAKNMEDLAKQKSKQGVFIIADMGSFFHRNQVDALLEWERSIPASYAGAKYCLICCYHEKDLNRLSEQQKKLLCEHHDNDLRVRPAASGPE